MNKPRKRGKRKQFKVQLIGGPNHGEEMKVEEDIDFIGVNFKSDPDGPYLVAGHYAPSEEGSLTWVFKSGGCSIKIEGLLREVFKLTENLETALLAAREQEKLLNSHVDEIAELKTELEVFTDPANFDPERN